MPTLDVVEVKTHPEPSASIIWLHGLGADGHDFEGIITELNLPLELGVRFIFPHAPIQPVSINGGYPMRSWFDILGLEESAIQDEPGIRKSQQSINLLIEQVVESGIPSHRIILGGFSQGGALALHTALRIKYPLAGVIGLSTYLPLGNLLEHEKHNANESLPVFLAHGNQDSIVPIHFGQISYKIINELGYPVTWREYSIPHSVSAEEVQDISRWIQKLLV